MFPPLSRVPFRQTLTNAIVVADSCMVGNAEVEIAPLDKFRLARAGTIPKGLP